MASRFKTRESASSSMLLVRLKTEDRSRLELIQALYGVSLTAAVRVCIRAAAEKLGLEAARGEDGLL